MTATGTSFTDSFTRPGGSAASLGNNWTVLTNPFASPGQDSFAISGNQAVVSGGAGTKQGIAVFNRFRSADATASVDVRLAAGAAVSSGGGVVLRLENNDQAYAALVRQGSTGPEAVLGMYRAGTLTPPISRSISFSPVPAGCWRA